MKRLLVSMVIALWVLSSLALAQEPVKIGFVYILSGRVAGFGMIAKQGAELALKEINEAGGVNGQAVEGVFRDTKADPDVTIKAVTELVRDEGAKAVIGIVSSKVAASVAPIMEELKVPLIITTATTPVVTGRLCNPYTFRVTWTTSQAIKSAALLAQQTKQKKWTTVGPDYRLGYESWELFQKYLAERKSDAVFAGEDEAFYAPLKTTDWKPILKKLLKTDYDGVICSLWGGNAIDFLRQADELGFFNGDRYLLMSVGSSMDVFIGLGSRMPVGIWFGSPYLFEANQSALNKNFVSSYEQAYKSPPSYMAQTAYAGVKAYAEAARRAGTFDSANVIAALEGLSIELPVGTLTIRPEDHQALFDIYWGQTSNTIAITPRKKPYRTLSPIVKFTADQVAIPFDQTGCAMKRTPME